jgi:flagellar assembly factor FliW
MTIDTLRFGAVEIDETKILKFKPGLPGLEEFDRFAVLRFEDSFPIIWLQSVDDGGVCLPVIDTFSIAPDYVFDISEEDVGALEITGPEDYQVLSVLVIPEALDQMTVNYAAPIVINTKTGSARQIVLSGGDYSVRSPVFKEICALIREEVSNAGTVEEA